MKHFQAQMFGKLIVLFKKGFRITYIKGEIIA